MFNNDHKLAGFTLAQWSEWRRFLRKHGMLRVW